MKEVYQDKFGVDDGNCFQACIASIFEIPISTIPHFCQEYPYSDEWYREFNKWLDQFGYCTMNFQPGKDENKKAWIEWLEISNFYAVAGVSSTLSANVEHAVVIKGTDIVHDPMGKNRPKFTFDDIIDIQVILVKDPSRALNITIDKKLQKVPVGGFI